MEVLSLEIKLRERPTYIHSDGRVEIHCTVDGEEHRIFMTMKEYMMFVADQVNALTHHLTGETNPRIT
jgi:antirestriction protein ArdC